MLLFLIMFAFRIRSSSFLIFYFCFFFLSFNNENREGWEPSLMLDNNNNVSVLPEGHVTMPINFCSNDYERKRKKYSIVK